jgi:cytochrome P450
MQLAAQVISFLLAGYETNANTMAFVVYFLSTHPEAQRRLQQEVDDVLGGRAPTLDDIPKVRGLAMTKLELVAVRLCL